MLPKYVTTVRSVQLRASWRHTAMWRPGLEWWVFCAARGADSVSTSEICLRTFYAAYYLKVAFLTRQLYDTSGLIINIITDFINIVTKSIKN